MRVYTAPMSNRPVAHSRRSGRVRRSNDRCSIGLVGTSAERRDSERLQSDGNRGQAVTMVAAAASPALTVSVSGTAS